MFDTTLRDGVLRISAPGAQWLATGWNGGFETADAAYNVQRPEGWERQDLDAYLDQRLDRAGFAPAGPAMLTGVDLEHLTAARLDPVVTYATVGLSNPAELSLEPSGANTTAATAGDPPAGTVNLVVGTTRALDDGALATLLGTVVEAKTATLQATTGFTGTTSDAVVVASDPGGEPAVFAGSATAVGSAARASVRDAVTAGLRSRYADATIPDSVADASHGVRTDRKAAVFDP
ncbi:adenosylcobinamide amidohydrolase [Halanaeroarchaeum sulfurireducens]|uniref:Adenosylcobinamide amidohydrolase n=1 Tax=Halanaeroarchaeum sulfurireducens TaxID=1604004 RepID=A0A0N7FTC9_9EURY|nr:adenosylcobinamide amidohydrolase [Halanaeroarchaeum sulfurireducens]ALG81207.1 adenosylcobinamide amidohydrolase [Halanaeroarchaeum sulfurireducens]